MRLCKISEGDLPKIRGIRSADTISQGTPNLTLQTKGAKKEETKRSNRARYR
jgi:hypothetical protein